MKIVALIVLVLAVMRVASWTLGWAVMKFAPHRVRLVVAAANAAAFAIFAGLLAADLAPGEPVDYQALAFGLVVFTMFCLIDLRWRPWHTRP